LRRNGEAEPVAERFVEYLNEAGGKSVKTLHSAPSGRPG
jgi:hypothetical protein